MKNISLKNKLIILFISTFLLTLSFLGLLTYQIDLKVNPYIYAYLGLGLISYCLIGAITFKTVFKVLNHLETIESNIKKNASRFKQNSEDSAFETKMTKFSLMDTTIMTIEQMKASIDKNTETSERMTEAVEVSHYTANKGKEVVLDMLEAVNQIYMSNEKMVKAIENSNHRISEVVQVISEIDTKTKVINDIVFQTKLLSFNASVEAARAGEHGKGFSVVAEEIGKLAAMSGSSALEISVMLAENIEKVNVIVKETNESIKELVSAGKEKVEIGKITATESDIVLDEVVRNISKATHWINEIMNSNLDQEKKILEIGQNMTELRSENQMNKSFIEKSQKESADIVGQARDFFLTTDELLKTFDRKVT